MGHYRVWIETTKKGTFLVRHEDESGRRLTDYAVGPNEEQTLDGKRLVGRTLAKRLRDKIKQGRRHSALGLVDPSLALDACVDEYLLDNESNGFSHFTVTHHRNSLEPFLRDAGMETLADLATPEANAKISQWKYAMLAQQMASETIRGRLADLRAFLNWLVEKKRLSASPFGKKMMPQKKGQEPKYYTTAEYQALDQSLAGINHYARIAAMLAHDGGLRKIEMVGDGRERGGVLWEDITWLPGGEADLLIRKEVAKGGAQSGTVRLTSGILDLLGSRKTGPLIPLTRYQFDHFFLRARSQSGINPDLDIHGLRHTFAKNFLQRSGENLAALQKAMRHKSILSTMVYAQFESSHIGNAVGRAYDRRLQEEAILNKIRAA